MQHLFIVPGNSLPSIPQEQDFLACSNTCTHPSAMTSTGWSEPVQSASITLATLRRKRFKKIIKLKSILYTETHSVLTF